MAIYVKGQNDQFDCQGHYEFICDTKADIILLVDHPVASQCRPGSKAFCIGNQNETCSLWMLNNNGEWVELT